VSHLMKILPLIVCLLSASPAFSQPRVYTNADLGGPVSPNKGTVTTEQLASLAAHQFALPQHYAGPTVFIGATSDSYMTLPHASATTPLVAPLVQRPYLQVGYRPYAGYTGYAGYRGYQAYPGLWRSQNAVSPPVITTAARAFRPSLIPPIPVLALAPVTLRTTIRRGW
jgi:hypothetical protein